MVAMTLTKAELADQLYEKVGLNKREAKDMVGRFSRKFELRSSVAIASSFPASAIFSYATSRSDLDAILKLALKYRSLHAAWSRSTPVRNSRPWSNADDTISSPYL